MDKKQLIFPIILLSIIVLILIGFKSYIFKENRQNMELYVGGDDYSHLFHLSGIVVEKDFNTLLVELNDTDESILLFNEKEISLDCTKCKMDLMEASEGDIIKFYFFKYNIEDGKVKVESIVK